MRSYITRDAEIEFVSTETNAVTYRELDGFSYTMKSIADRVMALLALTALAIPMLIVAAIIKLTSPGPVFVKQERVGRFGRPFGFYKFRSMRADAEMLRDQLEQHNEHDLDAPLIFKMRRDPRITGIGGFLRRTSMDELPNLFNVIKGEMSIIGPRPPLPREVAHYDAFHMQRLAAVPGMTGLWQVRGRSEIPFEEMVAIDLEYIDNWSLWLDLKILLKTPIAVIGGRGAW
jgi:lipopolysaccharide/colanic/teichoic acid biosynthesis glycosyltransferase